MKKYGRTNDGRTWGIFKNKNMPGFSVIYGRTVFDMLDKVANEAPEKVSTEIYPTYEMAYSQMRRKFN